MIKKILQRILVMALLVVGFVAFSLAWQYFSAIPIYQSHSHQSMRLDEHEHTHDGTLISHGHHHVGLIGPVTHTHPHVHRHEHKDGMVVAIPGEWQTIRHVHEEPNLVRFVAKCSKENEQIKIEFGKVSENGIANCNSDRETFLARLLIGSKVVEELLFEQSDSGYVADLRADLASHPLLNVMVLELQIDGESFDFTLSCSVQ